MPRPFTTLAAVAAPLPIANVDTDQLVPSRFLKTLTRAGLGRALLHAHRFNAGGGPIPDFVLNRPPWDEAGILVTLDNFGCGSSREHAAWALIDFGIRVVIAPSVADIFRGNFVKNGGLPIVLDADACRDLIEQAGDPTDCRFEVSLLDRCIRAGGRTVPFAIPDPDRERLLSGADEIDRSLTQMSAITAFERDRGYVMPTPVSA